MISCLLCSLPTVVLFNNYVMDVLFVFFLNLKIANRCFNDFLYIMFLSNGLLYIQYVMGVFSFLNFKEGKISQCLITRLISISTFYTETENEEQSSLESDVKPEDMVLMLSDKARDGNLASFP